MEGRTKNCTKCGATDIPPILGTCPQCGAGLTAMAGMSKGFKIFLWGLGGFFVLVAIAAYHGDGQEPQGSRPGGAKTTSLPVVQYSFEHEKTENQYGVEFYYFKAQNAPPVEVSNGQLSVAQINAVLTSMGHDNITAQPDRAVGRDGFVWENYKSGALSIEIHTCTGTGTSNTKYTCVKKVMVTPSPRTKMEKQAANSSSRLFVSREMYGEAWPFLVDFGIVACRRGSAVVFRTVDRNVYALNGIAKTDNSLKDLGEICRDDPNISGLKVSVGRFISEGLKLCDQ